MKRIPKPKLDFTHDIGTRRTLRMESVNCELIVHAAFNTGYFGWFQSKIISDKIRENLRLGF